MKPQKSKDDVIQMLLDQGLWKDRSLTRMCVVGVRGYYLNSMGKKGVNDRGIYDDAFFVLSPDSFASFHGNTDPSKYQKGIAMLVAPQKIVYRKGWHGYGRKSGHNAFRQASDVKVTRDGSEDVFWDSERNRFWTNNHKGGNYSTSSAGCLTVPANEWDAYYAYVCMQMKRFGQATFNMYLVENKG